VTGDVTVDSRGRRCPLPIIDLAAAARQAPAGTTILLLADDPAADADVAAWCRMRGHAYEGSAATDPAAPDGPAAKSYRIRLS
jgi:tRNA 2-thiouridine synthesizing protein A